MTIKKGDIVGRISYGKDILFIVDKIITIPKTEKLVILKGLNCRIEADSYISDLELIDKADVNKEIKLYKEDINKRINEVKSEVNPKRQKVYTGKILHLDGDRKYAEKSARYYNKIGLNGIVKNIPENRQSSVILSLLNKYNPDILIITGHDAMLKNGSNYSNIYNYRNSRHFINTVKEARKWGKTSDKLVIFARCMSKFF